MYTLFYEEKIWLLTKLIIMRVTNMRVWQIRVSCMASTGTGAVCFD